MHKLGWLKEIVDYLREFIHLKELRIPDDIDVEAMLPIGYQFGKTRKKQKIESYTMVG